MKKIYLLFFLCFAIFGCNSTNTDEHLNINSESINLIGNSLEVFKVINLSDRPIGWANSQNSPKNYGGYTSNNSGKIYDNVDSYEKLKQALSEAVERRIIFITGAIDLNAGKTPYDYIVNCGYGDEYSSYEDYKQKFAQTCVKDSKSELHDVQQNLFNAQKGQVRINIPSNTTIIGKNSQAAILNGEINITNKENIVIRNLKIWNAEDYFPLWYQSKENNFNSVYDNITIDNSKWIWIDHCTIGEDSYEYDKVTTPVGELDWVTYDGAIDIGRGSQFVTISWCEFNNHDKTMLIGYGPEYTEDEGKLQVTVHHNYFNNCKSRLPLVRYGTVHVYNNLYDCIDRNKSGFCVGAGYKSNIYAEKNVIKNCKYGFRTEKLSSGNNIAGLIYLEDNIDNSTYWDETKKAVSQKITWNPKSSYEYYCDEVSVIMNIK